MSAGIIYNNTVGLTATAAGSATQVLTSNGAGSAPTFQAVAAGANSFDAYRSATITNSTGDGTVVIPIIYDATNYNVGSNYNTTTGLYTVPVTGKYYFYATVRLDAILSTHTLCQGAIYSLSLGINVTNFYFNPAVLVNGGLFTFNVYGAISATAGATVGVQIYVSGGTKTVSIFGGTGWQNFGGWQIS